LIKGQIISSYHMKAQGGSRITATIIFLTSSLDEGERSALGPGCFIPKKNHSTLWKAELFGRPNVSVKKKKKKDMQIKLNC